MKLLSSQKYDVSRFAVAFLAITGWHESNFIRAGIYEKKQMASRLGNHLLFRYSLFKAAKSLQAPCN